MKKSDSNYQQCSLSVMDTIADPDIRFDENGICNYYYEYKLAEQESVFTGTAAQLKLDAIVAKIKKAGEGNQYDCIIGLSGGVDSTYLAWQAKQLGLRPLAVHFDNGWNSELAVMNIQNIVQKLDLDLYTYVINWAEFKDLQLSYLKASVVDIEAITDHAIIATLNKLASEKNIKYSLSGTNVQTENTLPKSWIFSKVDPLNIRAIHKQFGTVPLKTYPFLDGRVGRYLKEKKGIQSIALLNYLDYDKKEVKRVITKELAWRDYGGKHYESVWTRFYQGYILPTKFKIDKRKAHLSDLIFGRQLSKEEALQALEEPIYHRALFKQDYEFVLKKLDLTKEAFEALMQLPPRSHYEFDHQMPIDKRYPFLKPVKRIFRNLFPLK